jgi:xanthine dehydrogenase YagR molybdenum-binding subunit
VPIHRLGELGNVGTAAAIANAVFHATGVRVRDLPIVPARLLPALADAQPASPLADSGS